VAAYPAGSPAPAPASSSADAYAGTAFSCRTSRAGSPCA
jgi:hypothetical protein